MSDMSGQSAGGQYRPAGWYYAQGDPPDTQRYWDGAAWQGDPQPVNPTTQYGATKPEPSSPQGSSDFSGGYQAPSAVPSAAEPTWPPPGSPAGSGDAVSGPRSSSETSGSGDVGGFLSTLFDVKFNSFITGRAISVVYILVLVAVSLLTLFFVLGGLAGGGISALFALILGPLIGLFYLVMIRLTLEFFVNQFRQTELLEAIAARFDAASDD